MASILGLRRLQPTHLCLRTTRSRTRIWHLCGMFSGNSESYPLNVIDGFFAALRLITGYPTGYAQLVVLPLGWASDYKAEWCDFKQRPSGTLPPWFEKGYWNEDVPLVTTKQMQEVASLYLTIQKLNEKRLTVALRRFNLNSLRRNAEDGLLDAMIGLEALLSDGNQEMTYKVALRMAGL